MAERDEALFEYLRGAVVYGVIRNLMYPAHVHKGYEVLCMLEGELTVYTPMRTLRARPGHIVFIAENVIHGYVAQRGSRTLMLAYTPKGSEPFVPVLDGRRHALLHLRPQDQSPMTHELWNALLHLPRAQQNLLGVAGYVHFLLTDIAQFAETQPPLAPPAFGPFERALLVIGNEVPGEDAIGSIAESVGLSKYYFSRLFGQRMGRSYNTYTALMRVNAARRMMVQTRLSMEQIVERCGFGSQRSFNRQFIRLTGMTPRQYRKENQPTGVFDYECPALRPLLEARAGMRDPGAPEAAAAPAASAHRTGAAT